MPKTPIQVKDTKVRKSARVDSTVSMLVTLTSGDSKAAMQKILVVNSKSTVAKSIEPVSIHSDHLLSSESSASSQPSDTEVESQNLSECSESEETPAFELKSSLLDNFQQGDLVFGMAKRKDAISEELRSLGFSRVAANALNNPTVEYVLSKMTAAKAAKKLSSAQMEHFTFLREHLDYLKRPAKKGLRSSETSPGDIAKGAAIRRACKLLLTHRSPDRTARAHVVTNGIDWERVCDKKKSGHGVTDSEMRAAYRDFLENGDNPHIFFYDRNYKLKGRAPWERKRNKKAFDDYDQQRLRKKR